MTDAEKAQAEKAEAFFAKIPDPPTNPLVAAAEAHDDEEDADAESAPKAPPSKPAAKTETTKPSSTSTPADVADRVLAALKAGDLDTLADLTDQDPAAFDEKSTKWAARNRKEQKLKDEVAKVKADAAAVVEHYAPLDEGVTKFHATKDYALVKETVEFLFGEDFDSLIMKTFRAVRGQDPRVPELQKKLEATESEVKDARSARAKAADAQLHEALRDDLPEDHVVRKVPDWETRVAAVLRDSVDDTGEPALSFKQAAARVVRHVRDEYAKYADVFGDKPAPRAAKATTPERAQTPNGGSRRKMTPDEFFAAFAAKS